MTKTATTKTPAEMPKVSTYRLTREDYPRLQAARRLVHLEKLKSAEYENEDGLADIRIVYRLRGKEYEAPTLTAWGAVLAEQIAIKIEEWTPDQSVVTLTEMLSTMAFCDPAIKVDVASLKGGRIPAKLSGLIVIADSQGFGIDQKGAIVNLSDLSDAIAAGERLGMKFVKG
jgi:hypothetical protein